MITTLKVKDFALIEDIVVSFDQGLTVLTGETGAGKSIILEALYLIFAKRSDSQMIRHGKDKALVAADFILSDELMTIFELPKQIEIKREIDIQGKHKITLNDKVITLAYLKNLTDKIGSIFEQNDMVQLIDEKYYLSFIDQMDLEKSSSLLNNYLLKRSDYLEAKRHLESLKLKKNDTLEQKEFHEYQLNELKNYNLVIDEKEELEENISKLKNFDKISSGLAEIKDSFNTKVGVDYIYDISKILKDLARFDSDFKDKDTSLLNAYYEINDIQSFIDDKIYNLDFNEIEFNEMNERHYSLVKLEEKYKKTVNELINYAKELEEKIELVDNYDNYISTYEKKVNNLYEESFKEAEKLSIYRKKLSTKFIELIINELNDLDLPNAKFEVAFNKSNMLLEDGIDQIDFLISLNEGEPIRPLSKVASGGEKARFMFAIKSLHAKQHNLKLLVLDEIDIGISGKTAAKVANKMLELSKSLQLIVISHLPQVAAKANTHFGISKRLENNRMITIINKLNYDERILMIASMLSDESLSEFAISQAKMLLKK